MLSACMSVWLVAFAQSDDQLRSVVEKHQRYLDAIRTLQVEVQVDVSQDGGQTWHPEATVLWRKDGDRHRFTGVRRGNASPFRSHGLDAAHDFYTDRQESRLLETPDPPVSKSLRPDNAYGRVEATITDPPKWFGQQGPPIWLFLSVSAKDSLPDLNRTASRKKFLGNVAIETTQLWGLELEDPEYGTSYKLFLDPARNYALVRREVRTRGSPDVGGVHRVIESKEVKPGIHLPTHVQNRATKEPTVVDIRVLSIKVNEPLPEDAFKMNFPTGAKVRNYKSGETYIWGEDAPALTFPNQEAFQEWEREQIGYSTGRTVTKFVLINVGFLAAIGLVLFIRRRYRRKALAA